MAAKKKPARTWSGPEALEPLLVEIEDLTPDPGNARRHPDRNLASVRASLRDYGQRKPVVTRGGVVYAGNGTVAAARALGWTHVAAVDASDLTEEQARAYALADNRTGELSEWDYPELSKQLASLDLDAVLDLGWAKDEVLSITGLGSLDMNIDGALGRTSVAQHSDDKKTGGVVVIKLSPAADRRAVVDAVAEALKGLPEGTVASLQDKSA